MSWDDAQIGKRYNHCGSQKVNIPGSGKSYVDQHHSIYHNRDEYWIGDLVMGMDLGMRIDKLSKEGQKLTKMVKEGKKLSTIIKWLDQLVLKRVKVDKLYQGIKRLREECIEKGMRQKQAEICEALGIGGWS